MKNIELIVFEGAMCCATGVCGPEPDRELIGFNETVKKLKDKYDGRLTVMRASLTFNSLAFLSNPEIVRLVKENGPGILPVTTVNGKVIAKKEYMSYDELKTYLEGV